MRHAHAQIHELAPLEERALVDQVSDRDRAVGCLPSALTARAQPFVRNARCALCSAGD
jgi:hypothetical protein